MQTSRTYTILIAEEEEALGPMLEALAGQLPLKVVKADDGHSALRLCDEHQPALCFVDVLLPGLDGFEVCQTIKQRPGAHRAPVIMTSTVFAERSVVERDMRRANADGFLSKPARTDEVRRILFEHLPALESVERQGTPSSPVLAGHSTRPLRRPKVLVVEDQHDLNYIYRGFVSSLGLDTVGAFDGEEALQLFEREQPSLCLVDLLLPGINGFEVCRRLKALSRGRKVPVIIMSAVYRNVEHLERDLKRYQADDFIHKPFSMEALHELLTDHLPEREALHPDLSSQRDLSGPELLQENMARHMKVELGAGERGNLADIDFASLLFKIFSEELTGRLTIRHLEMLREIHFWRGAPVYAFSNSVDDALGTLLAKRGLLSMEVVHDVLLGAEHSGRLGQELVRRGLITEQELSSALQEQIRQRILACFGMTEGAYRFERGESVVERDAGAQFNALGLLRDGVSRFTSTNRLAELMEGYVHRYVTPTVHHGNFFPHFPASEPERRFMAAIDGRKTLSELFRLRILEISNALSLVWSLYIARMIFFSEVPGDSLSGPRRPKSSPGARSGKVNAQRRDVESTPSESGLQDGVSVWSQIFGDG